MMQIWKYVTAAALLVVSGYYLFLSYRPESRPPRYAFATLLSNFTSAGMDQRHSHITSEGDVPLEADGYFLGARYLNYMLQHHPETRSRNPESIPLLVLATPEVQEYKIKQLRREGAEVVITDRVDPPSWMSPGDIRYVDVLTKLRLWHMTQYDKICFIDADTLIAAPMDGIFHDPATDLRPTLQKPLPGGRSSSGLPKSYGFAAHFETIAYDHIIPARNFLGYFNAGFFVLSPDRALGQLYLSKLGETAARADMPGYFPEQDLLNDVHSWEGPMPWQELDWRWNTHFPTKRDLEEHIKSLHDKFWEDEQDVTYTSDPDLKAMWRDQVHQMETFYKNRILLNIVSGPEGDIKSKA